MPGFLNEQNDKKFLVIVYVKIYYETNNVLCYLVFKLVTLYPMKLERFLRRKTSFTHLLLQKTRLI